MRWATLRMGLLLLSTKAVAQAAPSDVPTADRTAIGQTAMAFVDAWNAHDAHAFALTFTSDGDFTNVLGVHVHGRRAPSALMEARVLSCAVSSTGSCSVSVTAAG